MQQWYHDLLLHQERADDMAGIDNDIRVVYGMCCPPCCEPLESYYYQLDPRSGTLPTP